VYWVDFVTEGDPKTVLTTRVIAEGKISRDELREKIYDHGGPKVIVIKRVRSEKF
jgi:hypothetical protein